MPSQSPGIVTGLLFFLRTRTLCKTPVAVKGVFLMSMIMIQCPKTGRAISTGRHMTSAIFRSTPVFCPLCRETYEWFAKDAWVCETAGCEGTTKCDGQTALSCMRKFLSIALVLMAFVAADVAMACVSTIHQGVPNDPQLLYMQEDPSLHMQEGPCHMARPYDRRPVPDCAF